MTDNSEKTENTENNAVSPEEETGGENNADQQAPQDEAVVQPADAPEETREDKLVAALAEIADLKDKLLRSVAETENIRRRAEREKADAANYAITAFARDLLSVGDNLRRALDSIPKDADLGDNAKNLVEGIEMTERDFLNMLERHNIKMIDPMGEKFNHERHQALFEVPDTDAEDGTVVQVMQVGYVIKNRLLRPAMVGVAKGGRQESGEHVDTTV